MKENLLSNSVLRVSVVQMCSRDNVEDNLQQSIDLVHKAVDTGATFIALPENCLWLSPDSSALAPTLFPASSPIATLKQLAREHQIYLLLGSVPEASEVAGKVYNTSVLIGPTGDIEAQYRKCFLFDVDLKGRESHLESERVSPGDEIVIANIGSQRMGMSICYDLRFPELYRSLSKQGASLLSIPAAFTSTTGRDHWEVLLRARAIENQVFVVAPDQWGHHGGKRRSYGRSMIVSPWGIVMAQVTDGVGIATADLHFRELNKIREEMPCAKHRRDSLFESISNEN